MSSRTRFVQGKVIATTVLMTSFIVAQASSAQTTAGRNVEWTSYARDTSGSRFAPLDQINGSNFNDLQVAWSFSTDNLGNRPEYKLEGTPLEIAGVIYTTGGNRRAVVALDAVSGELLWMHGEHEGARGVAAPRQLSGRGLSYWSEPDGKDARVIYVTPGYFLIALDARTGSASAPSARMAPSDMKAGDSQGIRRVTSKGLAEPNLIAGRLAGSPRPPWSATSAGRLGVHGRFHAAQPRQQQRTRAGLRCPYRQEALGMGHDPEEGREGLRHLAEWLGR